MTSEEQKLEDRVKLLEDSHEEIMVLLKPISETYQAINKLGKWGMAFLVVIATLFGIFTGWTEAVKMIFKH